MTPPPPRATFRPHERLRDPAAFRRAFDRRKTASDGALVVYAVENGLDHARLGISIGRKKVKRATERNRIKRLVREAFRLNKSEFPTGVDLVVVPRGPGVASAHVLDAFPRLARDAARRLGPRRDPPTPVVPPSGESPEAPPRKPS